MGACWTAKRIYGWVFLVQERIYLKARCVKVSDDQWDRLKAVAEAEGSTASALIRVAIAMLLAQDEQAPRPVPTGRPNLTVVKPQPEAVDDLLAQVPDTMKASDLRVYGAHEHDADSWPPLVTPHRHTRDHLYAITYVRGQRVERWRCDCGEDIT